MLCSMLESVSKYPGACPTQSSVGPPLIFTDIVGLKRMKKAFKAPNFDTLRYDPPSLFHYYAHFTSNRPTDNTRSRNGRHKYRLHFSGTGFCWYVSHVPENWCRKNGVDTWLVHLHDTRNVCHANLGADSSSKDVQLRSVSCHMGSHSVTCHQTQVNTLRLNPSQAGRYSIYLPRRDGRLSWPSTRFRRRLYLEHCSIPSQKVAFTAILHKSTML